MVIHPFLFAIFPILFLFSYNIDEVPVNMILIPLVITVFFSFILWVSLNFIFRDKRKAGLVTSLFLVLFFSYGHSFNSMNKIAGYKLLDIFVFRIGNTVIGPYKILFLLWAALLFFGVYLVKKTRRNLDAPTNILNIMSVFLVAGSLINIGAYYHKMSVIGEDKKGMREAQYHAVNLENAAPLRDIYYIILDGYANSGTLKKIFDYDNHEFNDYLAEKGFYVISEGRSNYPSTIPSLPSSMNMEYINYQESALIMQAFKNNKVMRLLKSIGYSTIVVSSSAIWRSADNKEYLDLSIYCGNKLFYMNEFTEMLIQTTVIYPLQGYITGPIHRGEVLCVLKEVAEVQKMKGPKFVFAHIPCPHPPYVFGRNGETTQTESTAVNWQPEWQYLDQLIFLNKRVKVLIEEILSEAEISPIIVLQGDHGPAFSGNQPSERVFNERTSILNAYHLPDNGEQILYDSITPVNTFRLIFNRYFNTHYPLLEDKMYFSEAHKSSYKYTDITGKVRKDVK